MRNTIIQIFLFADCLVLGGLTNGAIINFSYRIIPPPDGFDLTKSEDLAAAMSVMEPKHFLMPFLAHAIGAFVSAYLVTWLIDGKKLTWALLSGFLFMLSGASMIFILPSPLWFDAVDLGLAYIPMAWIGYKLALRVSRK
jgi:hypothetical protein